MTIESLSAITLVTRDMTKAVKFYQSLGFECLKGGASAAFTSFKAGAQYLNLLLGEGPQASAGWGRVIFYVSDVDAQYRRALAHGISPEFAPRDAAWGERYFHVVDPDGHEISFARPLGTEPASARGDYGKRS